MVEGDGAVPAWRAQPHPKEQAEAATSARGANDTAPPLRIDVATPAVRMATTPSAAEVRQVDGARGAPIHLQVVNALRILPMAEGRHEVHMRLNPPELGEVRVVLFVSEGSATVHLGTTTEAARAAIEAALPQLREALQQRQLEPQELRVSVGGRETATDTRGREGTGERRSQPEERPELPAAMQSTPGGQRPIAHRRYVTERQTRIDFRA